MNKWVKLTQIMLFWVNMTHYGLKKNILSF